MFYIDNDTNTTDKYDMAKFIDFTDEGVFNPLNSFMLYAIPQLPRAGYYTIDTVCAERPDVICYKIYGDTQYWWILMWYNSFVKAQDLKVGTVISYPSISALEQLYLQLSLNQKVQ